MAVSLFTGHVIAVIWDFDQTLIPGYQQQPLFEEYGIESPVFWREVNALTEHYKQRGVEVSKDTVYLNHLLIYVQEGLMPGLTNAKLRELGARLSFYPGMPEFLERARKHIEAREQFRKHEIRVEHYIVSTGLRQMILGSAIAPHVKGVWASDFIEEPARPGFLKANAEPTPAGEHPISQVGYFIDDTTKTRAIWEINKGCNVDPSIGVNDFIAPEDRRVPLRNMVYIADGPSDVPVFSILNTYGGRTMGVYNAEQDQHFNTVKGLLDQGRVQMFAEADYTDGSTGSRWILRTLEEIAELIVRDRQAALEDRVSAAGGHVTS